MQVFGVSIYKCKLLVQGLQLALVPRGHQEGRMSKETMAAVRRRRKDLGLVQMNVWIPASEKEAFHAATAPFTKAARRIEEAAREPAASSSSVIYAYRVTFPVTPPAALRNTMKASGWAYDRGSNAWMVDVTEATKDARIDDVVAFEVHHRAIIQVY